MSGIVALLVNLAIGAAGGNLAGMALKAKSLGPVWNSVVGILGGGLGYFVLGLIGAGAGGGGIMQVIAAFIGGAVLLFVVSLFKKAS